MVLVRSTVSLKMGFLKFLSTTRSISRLNISSKYSFNSKYLSKRSMSSPESKITKTSTSLLWEKFGVKAEPNRPSRFTGKRRQTRSIAGLILILITRIYQTGKIPTIVLAVVHGLAGMVIFILPISLSLSGAVSIWFTLVGVGGALIGLAGMTLTFLKMGKPIIPKVLIYKFFPTLLLVMTTMFVVGMSLKWNNKLFIRKIVSYLGNNFIEDYI